MDSTPNQSDSPKESDSISEYLQNIYKDYDWYISDWSDEQNELYYEINFKEHKMLFTIPRDNNKPLYFLITLMNEIQKKQSFHIKIHLFHQDNSLSIKDSFNIRFEPDNLDPQEVSLPIKQREIEEKGFVINNEIRILIQIKIPDESIFSNSFSAQNYNSSMSYQNDDIDFFLDNDFTSPNSPINIIRNNNNNNNNKDHNINYNESVVYYPGLKNQGATCYMNSLLQVLFHLPCFRRTVFEMEEKTDKPNSSNIVHNLKLLFAQMQLQIQMNREKISERKAVSTTSLTKSFGWTFENTIMQHDVQEFCRVLLSNLEEKMKGTKNEDSIKQIFSGVYQTYTKGINHNFKNTMNDEFYDLSLQVKDCSDIYQSFEKYVEEQILDGDNKYSSQEFGMTEAIMGIKFVRFPRVLYLHLKRFEIDPKLNKSIKINSEFKFYKTINLSKFCVENENENENEKNDKESDIEDLNESREIIVVSDDSSDDDVAHINQQISEKNKSKDADNSLFSQKDENSNSAEYDLFGVLVHSGSVLSGHFYAYLRPNLGNKWYKFNDSTVTEVSEEEAITKNFGNENNCYSAYMLIYSKKSEEKELFKPVEDDMIPSEIIDECFQLIEQEKEMENQYNEFMKESSEKINIFLYTEKTTLIPNSLNNQLSFNYHQKDGISFTMNKSMTKHDLYSKVSELYSKPINDIELWQFNSTGFDYEINDNEDSLSYLHLNNLNLFVFTNMKVKDQNDPFAKEEEKDPEILNSISTIHDDLFPNYLDSQKMDYDDNMGIDFEIMNGTDNDGPFSFLNQTDIPIFVFSYCPFNSPIFTYLYSIKVERGDFILNTISSETKSIFINIIIGNENIDKNAFNLDLNVYYLNNDKLNKIKRNEESFYDINCQKGAIFVIESKKNDFINLIQLMMKVNGYNDSISQAGQKESIDESNDVIEMFSFGEKEDESEDESEEKVVNFLDVISTENINASNYYSFLKDINTIKVCSVKETIKIKYPNSILFGEFCRFLCPIFNSGSFILLFKENQNNVVNEDENAPMYSVLTKQEKKVNAIFIDQSFVNDEKQIKIRDTFVPFDKLIRLVVDVSLNAVSNDISKELLLPNNFSIADVLNDKSVIGEIDLATIRVLLIKNRKIQRILNQDDLIIDIDGQIRIEKVPDDQIGIENLEFIKIAFEGAIKHGPFLLPVLKDELSFAEIKEFVRKAINETEEEFSSLKVKFINENNDEILEFIDDGTIINKIDQKIDQIIFSKQHKKQSIFSSNNSNYNSNVGNSSTDGSVKILN